MLCSRVRDPPCLHSLAAGNTTQCTPLARSLFHSPASSNALTHTWVVGCLRCDSGGDADKAALSVPGQRAWGEWEDLSWAKLLWDLRQASRADAGQRRALLLAASLGAKALCEGRVGVHLLRRHLHDARAR